MNRCADLVHFYRILATLEEKAGGKRRLSECDGRMEWQRRGVYFFFEPGELRTDSGNGARVVRIGTHALKVGSGTSLWNRLSQHRGMRGSGGGNHRGSIFRLLVGVAIKGRDKLERPHSWGIGGDPGKAAGRVNLTRAEVLRDEQPLESAVSVYIRAMPFLWVAVDDRPGPGSDRGVIERNSIGLLSNYVRTPLDRASKQWLGGYCNRDRIRGSGLWNSNHVDEGYDPQFLALLARYVECTNCRLGI
jgi:hypothetical protein